MRTKRIMIYEPASDDFAPEDLAFVLLLVERKVPPDVIATWTPNEKLLVYDWAISVHLRASDNPVQVRPEPSVLHPYSPDFSTSGLPDPIQLAEKHLRAADKLLSAANERERQGREVGAARLSIESTLRCLKRRLLR